MYAVWQYFPAFFILMQHHVIKGQAPPLETYNVDPASLTVSGISSGGVMTAQLHYIFSNEIKGAGVIAGGPYLCALNLIEALVCMTRPENQDVNNFITRANNLNATGKIDGLNNIRGSKVYIFHGLNDSTVLPGSGRNLQAQYEHFGADIFSDITINAGHGQPVDGNGYGGPCELTNPTFEYINECGYNAAYETMKWLYGPTMIKPDGSYVADGHLLEFNQTEFITNPEIATVADIGMIYVPKGCIHKNTTCRIHVALHGCNSNMEFMEDRFPRRSQYCEVAELNNIIIIFPQTKNTIIQSAGCWDWFGYTNAEFATNSGVQPTIIRRMWRRVLGQV